MRLIEDNAVEFDGEEAASLVFGSWVEIRAENTVGRHDDVVVGQRRLALSSFVSAVGSGDTQHRQRGVEISH